LLSSLIHGSFQDELENAEKGIENNKYCKLVSDSILFKDSTIFVFLAGENGRICEISSNNPVLFLQPIEPPKKGEKTGIHRQVG
jgi:hypothetical protein